MIEVAQAASHSFGTGFMMKRITANFYHSLQAFFSLILIVLMLCPASFHGAVSTVWSKTDRLQATPKSPILRREETLAPVTVFSVLAAATTTTSVTSSADPSVFGQPVTFTATVTSGMGTPTGNVQFFDNGNTIGGAVALNDSGVAQLTTSAFSVGNHTITANYAGDVAAGFDPSSGPLNSNPQTVFAAATTTSVTSSADPSVFGQPVTFTATVSTAGFGTPTGNVQFLDNGNTIGGAVALNVSGQAQLTTSTLSVSNHTITAVYSGSGTGFNSSTGFLNSNPQNVNKASTTTGITSNQPNPVGTGTIVTYTATVSPIAPGAGIRTGTVTFFRNGSPICSSVAINANGQATCSFAYGGAGNYNITATYGGDGNFNASTTSSAFVQSVVGASVGATTTTVTSSANPSVIGQSVTFTSFTYAINNIFQIIPASGGYVQFYDGATPIGGLVPVNAVGQAQVTTSTLSLGNHTITAQFLTNLGNGAQGYDPSTGTLTNGQTVNLAPTAAPVSIDGRIVTATGRGIARARVTMIDSSGQARYALSNSSGYYRFAEIQAGGVSIFTVTAKGFQTKGFVKNLNESVTDLNVVLDRP